MLNIAHMREEKTAQTHLTYCIFLRVESKFHTHIQLVRRSKWMKPRRKRRYGWSNNIKMDLMQTGHEDVDGFI
jgi:hypothetical protein